MEVSALKHAGPVGAHARSPLLRLQSDERLVALVRRGNHHAFEALVGRYGPRLLAFCRHMLGSREDAEDVLQEVFAASFNAMVADERPINVRPWLYRIARNRSLNHLRKAQAVGMDSMDVHLSEHGLTTADRVHKREEFRLLMADVQDLPETQRTALLLREIDALSYEQIAEAMETTVPSVKSLLVRARVSLAEAAEARLLSCEEVRLELGEVAEGLKRTSAPVRRHLRSCERCQTFRRQLRATNRALAALFPVGPLLLLKKLAIAHLGTGMSAGGGAAASGGGAAAATGGAVAATGSGAAAAGAASAAAGGLLQAGANALATKAAAGLAAAAIVTAGAVEVRHVTEKRRTPPAAVAASAEPVAVAAEPQPVEPVAVASAPQPLVADTGAAEAGPAEPAPTPAAEPTPAATPAEADGAVQHEFDTTTLPTEFASSTQPTGAGVAPGQAPRQPATGQPTSAQPSSAQSGSSAPQGSAGPSGGQQEAAPAAASTPPADEEPEPAPSPTATSEPEPTPTPTPTPEPEPEPEPTPTPTPTPTPDARDAADDRSGSAEK